MSVQRESFRYPRGALLSGFRWQCSIVHRLNGGGMLPETLDKLLSTALTLIIAIVSFYLFVRFSRRGQVSLPVEIANHFVLIAFLLWFAAYAIATHTELDAMKRVFDRSLLPGLSISYAALALAFSVLFALLIITHRNMYLCYPLLMALAFSDLLGNLNLISGMQKITQDYVAAGQDASEPVRIWVAYYLANSHFLRIAIYMLMSFAGFMLFIASRVRVARDESDQFGDLIDRIAPFCESRRVSLEVMSKLMIVLALVVNEATIWSWRYDREQQFAVTDNREFSGYLDWSVSEFYDFETK